MKLRLLAFAARQAAPCLLCAWLALGLATAVHAAEGQSQGGRIGADAQGDVEQKQGAAKASKTKRAAASTKRQANETRSRAKQTPQPLVRQEVQAVAVQDVVLEDVLVADVTAAPEPIAPPARRQLAPVVPPAAPAAAAASVAARLPDAGSSKTTVSGREYSLTLHQLFQGALLNHPSLQAARLQARASAQEVKATERSRWPSLSAVIEADAGGAASSSTASKVLRVEQTIWDAGRNSSRITEAETKTQLALAQVHVQQQEVFIQIINAWQNLIGAMERKVVAQETLLLLRGYQEQMRRRVEAQASPTIDLELVDARVLQTEVEMTSADTSLQVAVTRLEQLSSLQGLSNRLTLLPAVPNLRQLEAFLQTVLQTDWQLVASQHASVAKARHDRLLVVNQLTTKQAEHWPQVYVRWDKPLDPAPSQTSRPSAFAGLRYTPGAGFATAVESGAIATRIQSQDQSVEAALREVQQTLQNDREEFVNARSRMQALERAVAGSKQVLESYLRQFQAGRKSWQDLLNSARDLAQNQYALADARASMVGAMHRLQLRMDQTPEFP
jgi:outer membrane protein, adhesin transport system